MRRRFLDWRVIVSMELLKSELTSKILGCAFAVYNELGPFLREYAYQNAMEYALTDARLAWQRQQLFDVFFRGRKVARGKYDILVEDQVILELKAVESLHPNFVAQLIAYLAGTGREVGFLLNFGHLGKLEYRRMVLTAGHRNNSSFYPRPSA